MKKIVFRFLQSIFSFILALYVAYPAFAHGNEPRLEISVTGTSPGGVVDIRGVDFDYEETVKLYLINSEINTDLGEAVADVEGVFLHTFVLPVDLPDGVYRIRAETQHHEVLSPEFSVQGPAILGEGGGQGARDEDDPLLAPMPTFAPGVVPGGVLQPTPQTTALETPTSQGNSTTLIYSILLGIGIIALVGIRILKRR
jgi:hypothetical protein